MLMCLRLFDTRNSCGSHTDSGVLMNTLLLPNWNSVVSMLTAFMMILIPALGSPFHSGHVSLHMMAYLYVFIKQSKVTQLCFSLSNCASLWRRDPNGTTHSELGKQKIHHRHFPPSLGNNCSNVSHCQQQSDLKG